MTGELPLSCRLEWQLNIQPLQELLFAMLQCIKNHDSQEGHERYILSKGVEISTRYNADINSEREQRESMALLETRPQQ